MKRLFSSIVVVALFAVALNAEGASKKWDDSESDNAWGTANNWTPSGAPGISDEVLLPTADTITLGAGALAGNITNTATVTLTGGDITLGGGLIDRAGGTLTFDTSSTLRGMNGMVATNTGTLVLKGTNLLSGDITVGQGELTADTGPVLLGRSPVHLNAGATLDIDDAGACYMRELSGDGAFDVKGGGPTYFTILQDATFGGTIDSGSLCTIWGPGTWTWTSTFQFSANGQKFGPGSGVTVGGASGKFSWGDHYKYWFGLYGGTMTIDESAGEADRWVGPDDGGFRVYAGGRFRYIGNNTGEIVEERPGEGSDPMILNMSYTRGHAFVIQVDTSQAGSTGMVSFGSMVYPSTYYSGGYSIDFRSETDTLGEDVRVKFLTSPPSGVNGTISKCFVQGSDFATYLSSTGIVAFGSAGSGTSYTNGMSDLAGPGATDTVLLDGTENDTQLDANTAWNALKIDGAQTLDVNGYELKLGDDDPRIDGMILKTGAGDAVITDTSVAKTGYFDNSDVAGAGEAQEAYVVRVNEGSLKITVPFELAAGQSGNMGKCGDGLLWLDPVAAFKEVASTVDGIFANEGALRLDPTNALFGSGSGNACLYAAGGVFELTCGGTWSPTIADETFDAFAWEDSAGNGGAGGGFAAYGLDTAFGSAITWGATDHPSDGAILSLNSTTANKKISLSGAMNLGTDTTKMIYRQIDVENNTSETDDKAEISGVISGAYTYHLLKTGPGELVLSNSANTYKGATVVHGGVLTLSGNSADSPFEVMNSSTVKVTAAVSAHEINGLKLDGGTLLAGRGTKTVGRIKANGIVTLGNGELDFSGTGDIPHRFTLIENDSGFAVQGTFNGLSEGGTKAIGGTNFNITYVGGDGDDVVLAVEDAPLVQSSNETAVASTTATLNGYLATNGGTYACTVWAAWSTNEFGLDSSLADWDADGTIGKFGSTYSKAATLSTNVTGLTPASTYYFNFFASNSQGAVWADTVQTFDTDVPQGAAVFYTTNATEVQWTNATLNAHLVEDGTVPTEIWVAWDTVTHDETATTNDWANCRNLGIGYGDDTSVSVTVKVEHATSYFFNFYATNSTGGVWGETVQTLTTSNATPAISTLYVTNIYPTQAVVYANLSYTGDSPTTVWAVYDTSDRGQNSPGDWGYTNTVLAAQAKGTKNVALYLPRQTNWWFTFFATNDSGVGETAWGGTPVYFNNGDITVSAFPASISEIGGVGTFTVSRASWATQEAVTVYYTVGGTASSGSDFIALDGVVTIASNNTSASIELNSIPEGTQESPNENVSVTLDYNGLYSTGTLNSASITIAEESGILVAWAGNYVSADQTVRNAGETMLDNQEWGDDASNDDGRSYWAFSESVQLNPIIGGNYSGSSDKFYGGVEFWRVDDTAGNIDARIVNNGDSDYFYHSAGNSASFRWYTLLLWKKEDFLNFSSGTVTFDGSSKMFVENVTHGWHCWRFAVKDAGQWYISETYGYEVGSKLTLTGPNSDNWAEYNPDVNLQAVPGTNGDYDDGGASATLSYGAHVFGNIEAVGLYIECTDPQGWPNKVGGWSKFIVTGDMVGGTVIKIR